MDENIREFLRETRKELVQLDVDLVTLDEQPTDREALLRAFRTFHSIKGGAGFLGLMKLVDVAYPAETLLSRLHSGELTFNRAIGSTLLEAVDAIKRILGQLER
jgi:two-component system chemotaxis sensor kinase CheA